MTDFDSMFTHEVEELLYEKGMLKKVPRHKKGHDQIRKILAATQELLLKKGYAGVSYGELSRKLSMAKGNIQYYFPSKDTLLRSAMLMQMESLKRDCLSAISKPARDEWEQLSNLIDWELEYSRTIDKATLYLEKRAYATRDPEVKKIINGWYTWSIERWVEILSRLRPELTRRRLTDLAAISSTILDGIFPFVGPLRIESSYYDNFDEVINREIKNIVKNFAE